jgi:hypothetical protein
LEVQEINRVRDFYEIFSYGAPLDFELLIFNSTDGFYFNRSSSTMEDFSRALDAYNTFLKTASEWLASKTTEVCFDIFS